MCKVKVTDSKANPPCELEEQVVSRKAVFVSYINNSIYSGLFFSFWPQTDLFVKNDLDFNELIKHFINLQYMYSGYTKTVKESTYLFYNPLSLSATSGGQGSGLPESFRHGHRRDQHPRVWNAPVHTTQLRPDHLGELGHQLRCDQSSGSTRGQCGKIVDWDILYASKQVAWQNASSVILKNSTLGEKWSRFFMKNLLRNYNGDKNLKLFFILWLCIFETNKYLLLFIFYHIDDTKKRYKVKGYMYHLPW